VSRTIIVLSDDVVSVYAATSGRYDLVDSVPWLEFDFISRIVEIMTKKVRGGSVMLLYDMVEQYYRKEVVPKVGIFDQQSVIKRKLAAAFPNYPIREPLSLKKDKQSAAKAFEKTTTGVSGLPFLFVAIPETDQLLRLSEALRQAMAVVTGIYLLPVESVSMVQELSKRLNGHQPPPERWTIFMSQHMGGGLRQIVIRGGELALTRLTPIFDSNMELHLWADEVVQEYNATISYLSRFGYTPKSETEVIVLGAKGGLEYLKEKLQVSQLHTVTIAEAARHLRLKAYADESLRYADVLHSAWLAGKSKFALPFKMRQMSDFSQARQMARVAMVLLWLGVVGVLGYSGYQYFQMMDIETKLSEEKVKLVRLEQEYDGEMQKMAGFGVDVKLIQASARIDESLNKKHFALLPFIKNIDLAMPPDVYFDKFKVNQTVANKSADDPLAFSPNQERLLEGELEISFPGDMKPEEGNQKLNALSQSIQAGLPDYTVEVSRALQDVVAESSFVARAGEEESNQPAAPARVSGAISIKSKKP
jgi:hypothetical protein